MSALPIGVTDAARTSTSSVFNVVTRSADTVIGLLDASAALVDMLNIKAQDAHHAARLTSQKERIFTEDRITLDVIMRHVDMQEEFHKRNYPNLEFDRDAAISLARKKLEPVT